MTDDVVMIGIAALMIKHSLATGHGDSWQEMLNELDWQLTEREREANELRKDAARYRWLRINYDQDAPFISIRSPNPIVTQLTEEYADAAIDAAIAASDKP